MSSTVVVGTWVFSSKPVSVVGSKLADGKCSCADAVKQGICVAELDPIYGQNYVGRGGPRNAEGHLELDAAIMDGKNLSFGAVTALQGVSSAISVASDVMHSSKHNMLTGAGASSFAKERGYAIEQNLLKPIKEAQTTSTSQCEGKDTLGVLALADGDICAGVTTSGLRNKYPGRVGDSALPGSGLYADTEGGAACCTGDGDEILKYCPSFHAVLLMKQGKTAQEACDQVITDILGRLGEKTPFEMAMIAIDMKGNVGASGTVTSYTDPQSGTVYDGFPYTVYRDGDTQPQVRVQKPASRT